jgi:hypothetical protein
VRSSLPLATIGGLEQLAFFRNLVGHVYLFSRSGYLAPARIFAVGTLWAGAAPFPKRDYSAYPPGGSVELAQKSGLGPNA